jgi:steroid delta-isomerase-like uncharacterized protein
MTTEENKSIVREFFDELFNRGNTEIVNKVVGADYVDHSPLPAPAPGPEGFAKRVAALRAAFVREVVFGIFLAEGDLVAFTWRFNGVHAGTFAGIPATGRYVVLSGINVERLVDGKIVEHWSQFDLAGLIKQITTNQ